jgi:predicted porin
VYNLNLTFASARKPREGRAGRGRSLAVLSGMAAVLLAAAGVAQAQQSAQPAPVDESLTWHGITLYGIVDVDLQYETHGAPFNNYWFASGSEIVQKNSNNSVSGVASNGMSQSRVGLQGKEPLHFMDWSAVFKLETFFNPASGQISDAVKAVAQNNGRPLDEQSTNIDSSIAGQPFEQAFVGVSSPTYGTITFGRQNSTLADLIAKYDPQQTSYAFSLLGLSGTPAGGGDTEDRRLDASIKYDGHFYDLVHVGAIYKTQGSSAQSYASGGNGEAFSAFEVAIGAEYAGASIDGFYTKVRDAVAAGTLSTEQLAALPTNLSAQNSVSGTISDNASYGVMASYAVVPVPVTVYGGFQHITYMNPSIALTPGFDDIGGYVLGAVNNKAYAKGDKELNVYWRPICGHTAIHRRDRLLRRKAIRLRNRRRCRMLERRQRLVQRKPPRAVRVARLSFHQALRHLRGRHVVERVAWPRQRVHQHEHDRSDHRRAVLVLIDRPINRSARSSLARSSPGFHDRFKAMKPQAASKPQAVSKARAALAGRLGSV